MAELYPRVYPDVIPTYSVSNTVTEKDIITATIRSFLEKVDSTTKRKGKFNDIREMFEFQLKIEDFFRRQHKYRRTVMDKCTELIKDIMNEEGLHPNDKKGLISLMSAVMRMCMKIDN
jgi:hypothetical protein